MSRRGKSCNTVPRCLCTTLLLALWAWVIVGVVLSHAAIAKVIPPLKQLPNNIKKGFYQELRFDHLQAETQFVRGSAQDALRLCNATVGQCPEPPPPTPEDKVQDTSKQTQAILDSFSRALYTILNVTSDKYFGTDEMAQTADNLKSIIDELGNLPNATLPCRETNLVFCRIHGFATSAANQTSRVRSEIDKWADAKEVKDFKNYLRYLRLLHALPYVLVAAMLFFTVFWALDAASLGCCGSFTGGCSASFFAVLWLLFLIFSVIVVVIGAAVELEADRIIVDVLKGDPNLEEVLDHVKVQYPGFWNIAFAELVDALVLFYRAFVVFLVVTILIGAYGFTMCISKPYKEDDSHN